MRGSWRKKGGWRTGTPSRGTADAEAWKERGLPETLTLGSSLSNAISIHQEIMLALPSKYIQGLSSFPHSRPGAANGWKPGRGGGRGGREAQGELARHTHSRKDGDGTSSCRTLQAQQGVWKQGFLKEGKEGREGRNSVPGRGKSMNKDPEKREELQGGCSGLSGGERCELRQVRLAGVNTRLGASALCHGPWEPWVVLNGGGTGSDLCFRKTQWLHQEGARLETETREDTNLATSQSLLCPSPPPSVYHCLSV